MAHQNFPPHPPRPSREVHSMARRTHGPESGEDPSSSMEAGEVTSQKHGPTAPSTGARNANSTASKATPETNEASKAHDPVKDQYGHNGKTPPAMGANTAKDRFGCHDATPKKIWARPTSSTSGTQCGPQTSSIHEGDGPRSLPSRPSNERMATPHQDRPV
jgi:hypothetical protein